MPLARAKPDTLCALNQDRLFWSVADAYHGVTTSTNDVKELIPEFFFLPDFLLNANSLDLGQPQLRSRVDDVVLPPWAEGCAAQVALSPCCRAHTRRLWRQCCYLWMECCGFQCRLRR